MVSRPPASTASERVPPTPHRTRAWEKNMFRGITGKLVVTATAATALLMGAGASTAATAPRASNLDTAVRLMSLSYADFAKQPRIKPFDWSTDGCTAVGPSLNAVFLPACTQHDFGYRNFGTKGALKLDGTQERRAWIDTRFLNEMRRLCADQQSGDSSCLSSADTLYQGVRLFGAANF
jgi:hypothetical protein